MPVRKQFAKALRWFADNPEAGILALYLLIAAMLLLEPPCIEMVRDYPASARYWYAQHSFGVYLRLWDRGEARIGYGTLVIEQLARAALTGATYLGYCAFRGKRPW